MTCDGYEHYNQYYSGGLIVNNPASPCNLITPGVPVRRCNPIDQCERQRLWLGIPRRGDGVCGCPDKLLRREFRLQGCGKKRREARRLCDGNMLGKRFGRFRGGACC